MSRASQEALAALEAATLEQLKEQFPAQWEAVGNGLVAAAQTRNPEAIAAFLAKATASARPWRRRLSQGRPARGAVELALPHLAMARMAKLATEKTLRAVAAHAATGQLGGTVRFGAVSGWLVQRLLFARGLQRKPVSMPAFRLLWPLIRRRRILMQLVQPQGIYCFYSGALIDALASRLGARVTLEIAAGDGTLARFLSAAGVAIRATDDQSWRHAITYPTDVEPLDARAALESHRPAAVVCSFPPPGNGFEKLVFETASVDLYVVITTRHRFAAGDWDAYARQQTFVMTDETRLAALVLPPELDPAVLLFRRQRPAP